MQPHHIAIYEEQSYLTASLEREYLQAADLNFRWFPYLDDFFQHLENNACEIAILDCPQFSQEQLPRIAVLSKRICLIVIAPTEDFEFECLLRELGVTSVLPQGINFQDFLHVFQRLTKKSTLSV
ncbi:MAG: hypothetical protein HON04_02645 [Planctomicrobium sp.]|nr:hypothetical protein [Planctomicrobium sp.]